MDEQFNIIIPILAALLTGGFLMIFIESQQVAGNVAFLIMNIGKEKEFKILTMNTVVFTLLTMLLILLLSCYIPMWV